MKQFQPGTRNRTPVNQRTFHPMRATGQPSPNTFDGTPPARRAQFDNFAQCSRLDTLDAATPIEQPAPSALKWTPSFQIQRAWLGD